MPLSAQGLQYYLPSTINTKSFFPLLGLERLLTSGLHCNILWHARISVVPVKKDITYNNIYVRFTHEQTMKTQIFFFSVIVAVAASARLLPIGANCFEDSDCGTNHCYLTFVKEAAPGTCQCSPDTRAGCPEGTKCLVNKRVKGGPPYCAAAIGGACIYGDDCESGNCFKHTCQCYFDVGCGDDESCTYEETSGYSCVAKQPAVV